MYYFSQFKIPPDSHARRKKEMKKKKKKKKKEKQEMNSCAAPFTSMITHECLLKELSGHILSFLLRLIQEEQLSVTGESMCTKYWLTA